MTAPLLVLLSAFASPATADVPPKNPPGEERQTLWRGGEGGYAAYRIPALIRSPGGTLLAFCEARKTGASDQGDIDLVLRRSTDDGRTWTPSVVLHEEGGDAPITIGNPCPIAVPDADDPAAGVVRLLFCRNNQRAFHTVSADDGVTWAPPREITAVLAGFDYPTVRVATGPVHGLRLTAPGPHPGRLAAPVWLSRTPLNEGAGHGRQVRLRRAPQRRRRRNVAGRRDRPADAAPLERGHDLRVVRRPPADEQPAARGRLPGAVGVGRRRGDVVPAGAGHDAAGRDLPGEPAAGRAGGMAALQRCRRRRPPGTSSPAAGA